MKNELNGNLQKLKINAPKIFEILNYYYPLGYSKEDKEYLDYKGIKELLSLISDKISGKNDFYKNWQNDVCLEIENLLGKKVIGASFGLVPNFGGRINLSNNPSQNYYDELQFYVSFLKNIYSIQVLRVCKNMKVKGWGRFRDYEGEGIETLIVSPVKGYYEDEFNKVENFIKNKFKEATFLPYSIDVLKIEGLDVTYCDIEYCPVGEAFFSRYLPLNYYFNTIPVIIGDVDYKLDKLS